MGDIVSIKRSNDDDLFVHFESACPKVPADVDDIIRQSAARALGGDQASPYKPSFRNVFLVVGGVCGIAMMLSYGVTTRWNNAVDSAARKAASPVIARAVSDELASGAEASGVETAVAAQLSAALPSSGSANSWQRTRGAWAEYITRLESDPYYQYVLQEKRRFESRYPNP